MSGMTNSRALEILTAGPDKSADEDWDAAFDHIAARLRGEAQAEQMPFAWSIMEPSDEPGIDFYHTLRIRFPGEPQPPNATPLYTRPQAALSSTAAPSPALREGDARQFDGKWMVRTDPDIWRFVSFTGQDVPSAPAPVAGDAVARLADELMDASDVEDGDGNPGASIAFADAAGRLRTALAQDRASQGGAAVPDGYALVPTHWNESLLASAGLLEATKCPIDALQAKALRKMADRLAAAPTPAAGVDVSEAALFRAAEALRSEWNLHYPDAVRMAKTALTAALRTGGGA